jgi:sec-independent protein translocase protein TatC
LSRDVRLALSGHINELRRRLKTVFTAFVVILVVLIFFPANPVEQVQHLDQYLNLQFLSNTVIAAFLQQVHGYVLPQGWSLIAANGIAESMEIYFVASIILTLVFTMPVIAYETYKFVDPALKEEERKLIYPFVISTSTLFVIGILFGYFVLSKFLVLFLAPFFQATGTSYLVDASSFYFVIFLIIGATGVSFTAPAFVYSLIRLRILDPTFFSRNRLIIWFAIWVVTGLILTPDGGPLLDLVIFLPIVLLVEVAVFLGRRSISASPNSSKNRASSISSENRCRYCNSNLQTGMSFCPNCRRAAR